MTKSQKIPLSIKLTFLFYMMILFPSYWMHYGPGNFLWFSDIVLFLVFFATIFESRLLASMAVVGGLFYMIAWNIDFFWILISFLLGNKKNGLITNYMFDSQLPLWIRLISCFHIILPFYFIWITRRLGYHKMGWIIQSFLFLIVIILTWLFTDPLKNINFVYSYKIFKQIKLDAFSFLTIEFIIICVILFITHIFIKNLLKKNS